MRTLSATLLLCAALGMSSCKGGFGRGGGGDSSPEVKPSPAAQEAAQQGLQTMQVLVTEGNFKGLGFDSADQVKQASLGQPMTIYSVGLDQLKAYKPDTSSAALLSPVHRSIYPVVSGDRVLSSLAVSQREDGFRTTDFGNAALVRLLSSHRQSAGDFVVWVPALKVYFTARGLAAPGTGVVNPDEHLMLTPIMDDPRFPLKAGEVLPAERVFGLLQKAAAGVRTDAPL